MVRAERIWHDSDARRACRLFAVTVPCPHGTHLRVSSHGYSRKMPATTGTDETQAITCPEEIADLFAVVESVNSHFNAFRRIFAFITFKVRTESRLFLRRATRIASSSDLNKSARTSTG